MSRYTNIAELEEAIAVLIALEPRFAPVHQTHGTPSLRQVPASLETLLIIVTEQFLSLKAAAAIWARLKDRIGDVTPENVLAVPVPQLVALGLSNNKAKCFHACAAARFDYDELMQRDLMEIRQALLSIWGIGPWTADIFLLSAANHADAWPAGDVALQAAAQHLFRFRKRPDVKRMEKIAQKWRPHRAAAARLLWAHYRGIKAMPQAPSQN
ncbi:DNA-3-methyladenine glycosylase family protein [Aestuariivirga litoralis]|uniref:DNA-3-methyladenine glycosylase family protein n=1 Tax=Aestuariivirga litoralis TaxID=2650924 RepID=UPI0018C50278|nr:DNA-3-methyladenine glycosylase 2 family protein [Aestuariivirga litoralis]